MVFTDEGNKNELKGLINFSKRRKIFQTLREIEQYQTTPYELQGVPSILSFLSELPHNDADELYRLSLLREPRGAESKRNLKWSSLVFCDLTVMNCYYTDLR